MNSYNSPFGMFSSLPPTGKVTKNITISIFVFSLLGSYLQRKTGFGSNELIFNIQQVLGGEVWRLFTYPLVLRGVYGLLLGTLVFWIFGRIFESSWGERDFLRFVVLSWYGAALIAIPLSFVISMLLPFHDYGVAEGPGAAIDALLVSMALKTPNSNILFGFVIPLKVRTVVYFLIFFEIITGIQTGASGLSVTLGGLAMGYILTTGIWRPQILLMHFKKVRNKYKKSKIRVVPPKGDKYWYN